MQRRSGFKVCEPGYIHIDMKCLPQKADEIRRRPLFVAIDRATLRGEGRLALNGRSPGFTRIFRAKIAVNARRLLCGLERACAVPIRTSFTNDGKESTNRLFRLRTRATTGGHEFDTLYAGLGTEHRLTPPKSPQSNGMVTLIAASSDSRTVELFKGCIEELLQSHHFRSNETLANSPNNIFCLIRACVSISAKQQAGAENGAVRHV